MDERQTVFALTGRCLAHEHAGIVSDAIVMSKAIGGGYPLDVLACRSKCDRRVPGTHAGRFATTTSAWSRAPQRRGSSVRNVSTWWPTHTEICSVAYSQGSNCRSAVSRRCEGDV